MKLTVAPTTVCSYWRLPDIPSGPWLTIRAGNAGAFALRPPVGSTLRPCGIEISPGCGLSISLVSPLGPPLTPTWDFGSSPVRSSDAAPRICASSFSLGSPLTSSIERWCIGSPPWLGVPTQTLM